MLLNKKMPKNKFYIILILTSIIILSMSLESMFRVKDLSIFEKWISENEILIVSDEDFSQAFSSYLTLVLSSMFIKIITPASLSIYSYYAYSRIRINKLFIFIWTLLLLGGLGYELLSANLGSIFFYINIIAYIFLIINIISLNNLDASKQRGD